MDATMTKDYTQVRIRKDLWEAIKSVADENGMSGAAMIQDLMVQGASPGYRLAEKLKDLQAYCEANSKELANYFEHDGDQNYEWLKDFIEKTLEAIDTLEVVADDYDED